jgi:hypothetical protein
MSDPILAGNDDARELREVMSLFDAPAYVRRARAVEGVYEQLLQRCRRQRDEWLAMVRIRLGQFVALSGGPDGLPSWLADETEQNLIISLHNELRPSLRVALSPSRSPRALRLAATALQTSIERFNERWRAFLTRLDLQPINAMRDGYNRHYVLEKECAMRSPRLARAGFQPLPPLTPADLETVFPPLPALRLIISSR